MGFIVIAATVILFITAWVGSPLLSNPHLNLLRVLFPSWRFFDTIQPIPKIHYRLSEEGSTFSEWLPLPNSRSPRNLKHLFHNPDENLAIAVQTQIEQLLNDIADSVSAESREIESLSSYKIVSAYVRTQILKHHPIGYRAYQFRIGVFVFSNQHRQTKPLWQDSIISPTMEV